MTWDQKVKFLKKSWEARKCKVHFSPMSLHFYQKCKNNGRCWVTHWSFFSWEIGVNISREFSRNEILVGDCHLRNCIMGTYFLQFENLMPVLLENFLGQLWWFPFRPFLNSKDLIAMLETNWLTHEEGVEKMTLYKSLYFFFQFQEGEFDYILPL